jgi:hypothetical protein
MSFSIWERMLLDSAILKTFRNHFTTEARRHGLKSVLFSKNVPLCLPVSVVSFEVDFRG